MKMFNRTDIPGLRNFIHYSSDGLRGETGHSKMYNKITGPRFIGASHETCIVACM